MSLKKRGILRLAGNVSIGLDLIRFVFLLKYIVILILEIGKFIYLVFLIDHFWRNWECLGGKQQNRSTEHHKHEEREIVVSTLLSVQNQGYISI